MPNLSIQPFNLRYFVRPKTNCALYATIFRHPQLRLYKCFRQNTQKPFETSCRCFSIKRMYMCYATKM